MGNTIPALQFALEGLTLQQQVISNNVANASTPGFLASNVSFESSLANALAGGGQATPSVATSNAPVGLNGNNVSLSTELVALEKNAMAYQAVSNQLTTQFQILSGSMGGQF